MYVEIIIKNAQPSLFFLKSSTPMSAKNKTRASETEQQLCLNKSLQFPADYVPKTDAKFLDLPALAGVAPVVRVLSPRPKGCGFLPSWGPYKRQSIDVSFPLSLTLFLSLKSAYPRVMIKKILLDFLGNINKKASAIIFLYVGRDCCLVSID